MPRISVCGPFWWLNAIQNGAGVPSSPQMGSRRSVPPVRPRWPPIAGVTVQSCAAHPAPLMADGHSGGRSRRQGLAGVRALLPPLRCDQIATSSAPARATTRCRSAATPPTVRGDASCPRVSRRAVLGNEVIFPPLALRTRYSPLGSIAAKTWRIPVGKATTGWNSGTSRRSFAPL
jgi:hypothetical protein